MQKLYRFLKSVKLAVVLIAWLAATGILSTLVPQGREAGFYLQAYPGLAGRLVAGSGFSHFFSSVLFLVPAGLFFVNLAACTVDRLLRELRRPSRRRHGPDILHVGLLVLVVGAVLSFAGRQTGYVQLAKGDRVELPGGRLLVLDDFSYTAWEDGRPRDWTSTVRVVGGGGGEARPFPIRVNHPLRLGRMSIYQVSHSVEGFLAVTDPAGREHLLAQGEEASHAGTALLFMAREGGDGRAVVRVEVGGGNAPAAPTGNAPPAPTGNAPAAPTGNAPAAPGGSQVLHLAAGEGAGGFTVQGFRDVDVTGLSAVADPGYPVVLVALALVLLGLAVTFIGKIGEAKT